MISSKSAASVAWSVAILSLAPPVYAQSDSNPSADAKQSASPDDSSSEAGDSPHRRLERAEQAFHNGQFDKISSLLDPILGDEPSLDSKQQVVRARELLGVGLYFEAQEATDADRRDRLVARARRQFLDLLRLRPDYELDSMMFPASVVELFESVREEHADELDEIRRTRSHSDNPTDTRRSAGTETVYIERIVRERVYPLNYVPLGTGQFQNDQPLKGALFGGGQLATAAVAGIGLWRIESLRLANGKFRTERICQGCRDYRTARNWRSAQWIALGTLGILYVGSVVDALFNYEQFDDDVRIRMRDTPPPELSSNDSSAGNGASVQLGFGSVEIRW